MAVVPSAMGVSAQRVGQYDFSYLTSGVLRATPVQVFDDGKSTFFQFRAGDPVPAIFVNTGSGGIELRVPSFEGPYVKVAEVAGRFTLQLGRAQAQVVYGGVERAGAPKIAAVDASGMSNPYSTTRPRDPSVTLLASIGPTLPLVMQDALESNSYATPVKGDRVEWKDSETETREHQVFFVKGSAVVGPIAQKTIVAIAKSIKADVASIIIVGRDDDTYKEGLDKERALAIKQALVKAGVDASKLVVKTGVQAQAKNGQWASDIRVESIVPTKIARPTPSGAHEISPERLAYVKANLEGLIRSGVLTREQAATWLARHQMDSRLQAGQMAAQIETPPGGFDFKLSDKTVATTIRRWAGATNYKVVWDAPASSDAPITGDAVIQSASIKEAMEKVVGGLQRKGYDIQATFYSNRVIRFTGSTK
jgi:outer membrane protein OmpA-like peptidoglycan-associated protein